MSRNVREVQLPGPAASVYGWAHHMGTAAGYSWLARIEKAPYYRKRAEKGDAGAIY
jgi:hypothetical protein